MIRQLLVLASTVILSPSSPRHLQDWLDGLCLEPARLLLERLREWNHQIMSGAFDNPALLIEDALLRAELAPEVLKSKRRSESLRPALERIAARRPHVVAKGETLTSIVKKHSVADGVAGLYQRNQGAI